GLRGLGRVMSCLLSAICAALLIVFVGCGDRAFRALRSATPFLRLARRIAALIGLRLLAAAAGGLARYLASHRRLLIHRINRSERVMFRCPSLGGRVSSRGRRLCREFS